MRTGAEVRVRRVHVGRVMVRLALCGLLACVCACSVEDARVAAGRAFPVSRLMVIKHGMTTARDVRDLLGEPSRVEKLDERKERWHYYMRKEQREKFLWFITTSTHVTETRVVINLADGLVDTMRKESHAYDK